MQLSIFDQQQAGIERDNGILQAVTHAEQKTPDWAELGLSVLIQFINIHDGPFLAEDVRAWGESKLPDPPSKRAWGGVIVKARNAGLIECIGFGVTKNVKAHKTPASLWIRK